MENVIRKRKKVRHKWEKKNEQNLPLKHFEKKMNEKTRKENEENKREEIRKR